MTFICIFYLVLTVLFFSVLLRVSNFRKRKEDIYQAIRTNMTKVGIMIYDRYTCVTKKIVNKFEFFVNLRNKTLF